MINWKVRLKNANFWLALVPAVLLVIQAAAAMLGYTLELDGIRQQLLNLVNAVFGLLAILGIVNDPTTAGLGDSANALTYQEPKK